MSNSNQNINFIVRTIRVADCPDLRELWCQIYSNKSSKFKSAPEVAISIDPNGLFVAQDLSTGKLIGSCSGIKVSPNLGFIGGYAVSPEYQGQGIGPVMWKKVMDYLGDINIALFPRDQEMGEKYGKKWNFQIAKHKRLVHMTGKVVLNDDICVKNIDGITVCPITTDLLSGVIDYDSDVCNGIDRRLFIEGVINFPETWNLVAINERREVCGYCIIYSANCDVTIVGPLYADNEQLAELLVTRCLQLLPEDRLQNVKYHCWDINLKSIAIAEKFGLKLTVNRPIMYSKQTIDGKLDKIFTVSSTMYYPF
ncbi:uncharacterized protein LOC128963149 [Oppia nitens]|uniref:uncharacterized protein LOC128963149 n=1 Tax=Oppia nitens TaxID=1686743 RepID=UPI0023DB22B0|nr:uncharacterized protein LOC128963149 [Oppia nitens]